MNVNIFRETFKTININGQSYRVIDSIFKKYFALSDVDVTKFTDVHEYTIEINDVLAPEIVGNNIIVEIHTGFTCDYIKKDSDNYHYYIKFIDMYMKHENITLKLGHLTNIRDSCKMMRSWLNGTKINPNVVIHDILCISMADAIRSLGDVYSKTHWWRYDSTSMEEFSISLAEGEKKLMIGFANKDTILTRMVFMALQNAKVNIYDHIKKHLNVTAEESNILGLDAEEYIVPTKFI